MYRQRYRNEALYPYDGPVAIKRRLHLGTKKRTKPTERSPMPIHMPMQLKMQLRYRY